MEKFGKFCITMFLFIIGMFLQGTVLVSFWNWFIVPLGVVKIGFWHSLGFSLMASTLVGIKSNNNDDEMWEKFIKSIITYLLIWGFGAIIHLFM